MSASPSAHATARRNLVLRIEAFLRERETMPTPTLTGWQADQTFMAIEMLDSEQFADGEWVMMKVEKSQLWEPAGYVAVVEYDAPQLLERLARVQGSALPAP